MMENKIEIRYQKISDAEEFFRILNNPNFIYFTVRPECLEDEIKFLEMSEEVRKNKSQANFSILYNGKLVGGCGIKIDSHRNYLGEIGYFIDEEFWGKSISTEAVKLMEEYAVKELHLKRIEILMLLEHKASEKVAIKSGYTKEGIARNKILHKEKYMDCHVYAKTF
jgi:[ribosomal protein S5]-alanine N-acetyltransferase